MTYKGRFRKESIQQLYRKIIKKSISPEIDRFLFFAAVILISGFIVAGVVYNTLNSAKVLVIAREYESLFGRETINTLIQEFEARNPGIRIKPETTSSARKRKPAIVFFDESQSGLPAPQDSHDKPIPLILYMDLLFYNIDILKAAGFDRPPKTRTEFLACAKTVSKLNTAGTGDNTDGIYGAALGLSPNDPLALRRDFFSWIWAAGKEIRPEANSGTIPPAASELIAFLEQLHKEGALSPGTLSKTGTDQLDEFVQGKAAMIIASMRNIPRLQQQMQAEFGITLIPGASGPGKNSLQLSGIYAGISSECAYPDEARLFLSFLAGQSPLLAAGSSAAPGGLPASGFFPGGYTNKDPLFSKIRDIYEASDIIDWFPGDAPAAALELLVREKLTAVLAD